MQLLINKSVNIDMATMTNFLATFEGKIGEDVVAWLDELLFTTALFELTEEEQKKNLLS